MKLSVAEGAARIVLENSIRAAKEREASSLGLGLRVVRALIAAQKQVTTKTEVAGEQFRSELTVPNGV